MKPQKIIIYGGAFNPPTIAHEAILEACVKYVHKSGGEVWIVPSGNRFDKHIPVERELRIKYINAMIKDINTNNTSIKIVTTELDRLVAVETYDTAQRLMSEHPSRSFVWVYGADSIETMSDWKNGQWLLDNLKMLVVERQGSAINALAKNVSVLDVKVPGVSSTEVRRRLDAGELLDDMVGKSVRQLLGANEKTSPY